MGANATKISKKSSVIYFWSPDKLLAQYLLTYTIKRLIPCTFFGVSMFTEASSNQYNTHSREIRSDKSLITIRDDHAADD